MPIFSVVWSQSLINGIGRFYFLLMPRLQFDIIWLNRRIKGQKRWKSEKLIERGGLNRISLLRYALQYFLIQTFLAFHKKRKLYLLHELRTVATYNRALYNYHCEQRSFFRRRSKTRWPSIVDWTETCTCRLWKPMRSSLSLDLSLP